MGVYKFYLFYIPIAIVLTFLFFKYLKNKDKNHIYKILIYLSVLTIILHLIKPLFFPYNSSDDRLSGIIEFPSVFRKITFENICAVSALIYFPVLLSKNKVALDYISVVGMLGGLAAFLYPTEVILGHFDSVPVFYKLGLFSFDTIRFYLVHYLIFLIPFTMLYFKIHQLDNKRSFYLIPSILLMMVTVLLNEYILMKLGWLDSLAEHLNLSVLELFLSNDYRNSSFVFGVSSSLEKPGMMFMIFVPKFLKNIPVLWFIIPATIYAPTIYIATNYLFSKINNNIIL